MPKHPTLSTVLGNAVKSLQKLRNINHKWIDSAVLIELLLKLKLLPEVITVAQCNRALSRSFPGFEHKELNTHIIARRQTKVNKNTNFYGYYLKMITMRL